MTLHAVRVAGALALAMWSVPAFGTVVPPEPSEPEQVVEAYAEAIRSSDWAAVALLHHPDYLRRLRELIEETMSVDPSGGVARMIFEIDDPAKLAGLSDPQLVEASLKSTFPRDSVFSDVADSVQIDVLGTVRESDDLRHLVVRERFRLSGAPVATVRVITFKRKKTSWLIDRSSEIEGAITAMRKGAQLARENLGTLVLSCDEEVVVSIDGKELGAVEPGRPAPFSVPAGSWRVVAATRDGGKLWTDRIEIKPKERLDRTIALEATPAYITQGVTPPVRTVHVQPVYPEAARLQRREGKVVLEIVIDREGDVTDVRVLQPDPPFDEAAVQAVRSWKYTPAMKDGRPVKVYLTVVVEFHLKQREAAAPGQPERQP